ncbi:MAG: hypothetical protein EXR54_08460 [Dehalococcoidia bacterium]|nr:hypothetical protein [Dehalococcoidia bacterium]MSQ17572.1 hypothetical protein [Dehalococcoidia bacterium]
MFDREFAEYSALVEKGWSDWPQLDKSVAKKIPAFPGIYEIGTTKAFPRLKGQTRILYIGASDKRGIRRRIQDLLRGTHVASKRLEKIRGELSETLWIRTLVTGIGEAEATEKAHLSEFE